MNNLKFKNKFFQYSLVWLIAAMIGCYFRLFPLLNFTTGETTDKATLYVINYLRAQVTAEVNKKFPTLPSAQKEIIIKKQFDAIVREEKQHVRSSIDQISQNIQQKTASGKRHLTS